MVDEFQDTNETQFEIVRNSMNPDTNLFVVGDSKQSIYSFQGAEIEVFNNAVKDRNLFASIEDMSINYRSDGVVLGRVNAIFEPLLQKDEKLRIISQNYEAEAQALDVSKESRREKGSFSYLITSQEYRSREEREANPDEPNEMERIAQFISEIYHSNRSEYLPISELISKKEKAIAVIFDSSTKMLELKQKLRERGISAKVSASDNFYHTKEVNDIFAVLKAIDILSREPETWSDTQRYYLVGAMRSNILRVDDNSIKKYLDDNRVSKKLAEYVEVFRRLTLSQAVKYIYDDSNIMGVYAHFDDVEQRAANLYKFLTLCKEYEESSESNLHYFLSLIENAIYFSEAKEDEAFFQSDNTKSIELCTIHATKGLAYPLVLLGNADKGLYSQITSDALKHNNFTMNGERKEIVGFKINDYMPLSHRVLKQIDKMKHLAEKKRLLYVALTRAQHDVVISANLKQKQNGDISLREDSYLWMIADALAIEIEELYSQEYEACIDLAMNDTFVVARETVSYLQHTLVPLDFTSRTSLSATQKHDGESENAIDPEAARRGTLVHQAIALYWQHFRESADLILDKMAVNDESERVSIKASLQKFYDSSVYTLLKNGVEHRFELEFNDGKRRGYIDLVYFDETRNGWVIVDFKTGTPSAAKGADYQGQLDFYTDVLEGNGMDVVEARLVWL
jgi:ATP-dependent exoDNAse (exonuclease V) beta subunit